MNIVNGVISNGFAPRVFSIAGSVCLGEIDVAGRAPRHHLPGLALRQLVERGFGDAAERGDVARAQLLNAAAMGRTAHHLVAGAERVHDVERKQRDVRRLEHVAAGIEDEIGRRSPAQARLVRALPQPFQQRVVELEARNMFHIARDFAEAFDALAALRHRVVFGARHGDPRHVQQEARIDAIIAGLDAVAGEQARRCPFARGVVALAVAQDVDDAADDVRPDFAAVRP